MNHTISIKVAENLLMRRYDSQDIQSVKVVYSIECILVELEKIIVGMILFSVLHKIPEYAVCVLTTGLIRLFLGGIHMKSQLECTFFSIGVYTIAICLGDVFHFSNAFFMIVVAGEMICVYKYAPIPSQNRPKYSKSQIVKFKFLGFCGVCICACVSVMFPYVRDVVFWLMILQQVETYYAFYICRKEDNQIEKGKKRNDQ